MANRERGEVPLEAGGKTYTLRLSHNALCELEALLSTPERPVSYQEVLARILVRSRMVEFRALMWAALREFHPEMTVKDAGELIDAAGGPEGIYRQIEALLATTKPDEVDLKTLEIAGRRPRKARATAASGIGTH